VINLFRIFGVRDVVAISPKDLKPKLDINKVVLSILREKYEEKFIQEIGYIVCVISAKTSPLGVIVSRSGFLHNEVEFEFLAWLPMVKEVVEAEVADIKEFGAFLQMGPIEGLAHISQIIDDYVSYDKKETGLWLKN
jgi:DNA-directed RNA polymerase, subunit E''